MGIDGVALLLRGNQKHVPGVRTASGLLHGNGIILIVGIDAQILIVGGQRNG